MQEVVAGVLAGLGESSMKCIRFDVCKRASLAVMASRCQSSMKCIRFDVCKHRIVCATGTQLPPLNEVYTF